MGELVEIAAADGHRFKAYRAQPQGGHQGMSIGIEQFRSPNEQKLLRMLIQPFKGKTGNYAFRRDEG